MYRVPALAIKLCIVVAAFVGGGVGCKGDRVATSVNKSAGDTVQDVAYVQQGATLYLLAADGHPSDTTPCAIRFRDPSTGADAGVFVVEDGRIYALDGDNRGHLASSAWKKAFSHEHNAKVWLVPNTAVIYGHTHPGATAKSVALAQDGHGEASGDDRGNVRVTFDNQSRTITNAHATPVDAVAFAGSPSWRLAVACSNSNGVNLYDARNGASIGSTCTNTQLVESLACSPVNGLVAAGDHRGQIDLCDPDVGGTVWSVNVGDRVTAMAFTPDGKYLAYAVGDAAVPARIEFRRADAGGAQSVAAQLTGNSGRITGMSFRPDGTKLATCGSDAIVLVQIVPQLP